MTPTPPSPRSRTVLFPLMAIALVLAVAGAALTLWNIGQLRERVRLRRQVLWFRLTSPSMADLPELRDAPPERIAQIRACYKDPDATDLAKIPWNMKSRPTPFLNYAPEPGRQPEGTFNSQQMRTAREVMMPKPPGVFRIFVTGGSLAYGIGAPNQDTTIPAYLEKILNEQRIWPGRRVEVYNAAACGWTTTHERILIENRLSELAPDLVVALTGANDLHWGFAGFNVYDLRTYEDEGYFELVNSSLRRVGAAPYPAGPPWPQVGPVSADVAARRLARNMRLAAAALEPVGARLVVALQPTLSPQAKPSLTAGERAWLAKEEKNDQGKVEYVRRGLRIFAAALGGEPVEGAPPREAMPANLALVNIQTVFARRTDAIYIDLFHVADKGNELIARRLAEELAKP